MQYHAELPYSLCELNLLWLATCSDQSLTSPCSLPDITEVVTDYSKSRSFNRKWNFRGTLARSISGELLRGCLYRSGSFLAYELQWGEKEVGKVRALGSLTVTCRPETTHSFWRGPNTLLCDGNCAFTYNVWLCSPSICSGEWLGECWWSLGLPVFETHTRCSVKI